MGGKGCRVVSVCGQIEIVTLDRLQQVGGVYNKLGPRTEPCGTPNNIANSANLVADKGTS